MTVAATWDRERDRVKPEAAEFYRIVVALRRAGPEVRRVDAGLSLVDGRRVSNNAMWARGRRLLRGEE